MPKIKVFQYKNAISKDIIKEKPPKSTEMIHTSVSKATSSILKDEDYSYLLEKTIETFSLDELKYLEKLFTKHDTVITEKKKELIKNLKAKYPDDFISSVYDRLIKLELININQNNNTLCGKYITCNGFWVPFWLEGNKYKIVTKIKEEEIHSIHSMNSDSDEEGVYIFGQFKNQVGILFHFWFDKKNKKYTTLKRIEGEDIEEILYPVKNERGKIMYGKYKNSKSHTIPFWYSKTHEKYVRLKIEGETICDTKKRIRENEKKKLISGTFLNEKGYWLPFWLEGEKYVTLKIEGEEILGVKNRKSDAKGKLLSGEFIDRDGIRQKFELKGGVYIKKIPFLKSFFSRKNKTGL